MDPSAISPQQWIQLHQLLIDLALVVGLVISAAVSFLLSHAIIPSLVESADAPAAAHAFRFVLYPIFVACLLLMIAPLARALYLAVDLIQHVYPRFLI
jgi:hypothetical protein